MNKLVLQPEGCNDHNSMVVMVYGGVGGELCDKRVAAARLGALARRLRLDMSRVALVSIERGGFAMLVAECS
jgi:hypothetical protein